MVKFSKELRIAVFSIIIMGIAYWGINFLKGVDVLSSNYNYYAYYEQSENIETSAPVLIRGIKVGSVSDVSLEGINSMVKVTLSIDRDLAIPSNTIAELTDKSLMGGKAIALIVGDSPESLSRGGVIESRISNEMMAQIEMVKLKLDDAVDKLIITLDNLNALMSQENIENITSTLKNASTMSSSLNELVKSEKKNIADIVDNLHNMTSSLESAMPTLNNTLENFNQISISLANTDISGTIDGANIAIENLNKTIEQLSSENGSIGLLLNDASLYNNMSNLMFDIQENPKRYVHFSLFGKKN